MEPLTGDRLETSYSTSSVE